MFPDGMKSIYARGKKMSNRVTYILAGGQLSLPFLKEQLNRHSDRTIIAADRGLEACVSLGIEPDFVIGDFDSLDKTVREEFLSQEKNVTKLNPIKDDKDTEAALTRAFEKTEGDIIINKVKTNELNRRQIPYLRRNLGVVFQDFRLLPNKTVYENVAFAMRVIEAPGRIIRRNVPAVLSLVGLGQKGRSYPNQLSGGEQQRTALARAIANNPPILICDEPTGNLDPETAYGIMKLLDDINKRGTTIVMATHARDIVDAMQKRVVTLHKGHIIRDIEKGGYSDEA